MVEAAEPLQPLFAPQEFKPNKVDYFEGALQLLFYKLCMKMIDHSSRSTWGMVLPDPDYGSENVIQPHKNRDALQLLFFKVFTKSNG
jgi:hypothetical protein